MVAIVAQTPVTLFVSVFWSNTFMLVVSFLLSQRYLFPTSAFCNLQVYYKTPQLHVTVMVLL
jgi:hypothetical protein